MKTTNLDEGIWVGSVSEADISHFEAQAKLIIPQDYRYFIQKYGAGHIFGLEFYGLGCPHQSTPHLQWLLSRLEHLGYRRPQQLLPFMHIGNGEYVAIFCDVFEDYQKGDLVYWSPIPNDRGHFTKITQTFDHWLNQLLIS